MLAAGVKAAPQRLVSGTLWGRRGGEPDVLDLMGPAAEGVRWLDITPVAAVTDTESLLEALTPHCPGLEREMLSDLLCRDELPENRSWHDGAVRLASSFAVYASGVRKSDGSDAALGASADVVYEAVELLAGESWLITRWHDACRFRGAQPMEDGLSPTSRLELRASVAKRWATVDGGDAGDLGVLVMHELALTYAPTHRSFHAALEEWELDLYMAGDAGRQVSEDDVQELRDLWGARARLREWLNSVHVPGLANDPVGKAWLPARHHAEVISVSELITEALEELASLGDTLRSSFHLLHIQKSEAQRKRNERLQWQAQMAATIFIVPTLIVGFYGANTWVPGEHRQWGFAVMVAVIVTLTVLVMAVLWRAHRRSRL